jgi:2-polyprenyl-6-methoxyphenol hydroxylase-like FAD-dependent oxidoreductase
LFWNRRYQRRRKIDPLKRLGAGKSTDQISKNLYQAALDAGARVEFGKKISKVDVERAASVLEDGITVARGLVVGADGQPYTLTTSDPHYLDAGPGLGV